MKCCANKHIICNVSKPYDFSMCLEERTLTKMTVGTMGSFHGFGIIVLSLQDSPMSIVMLKLDVMFFV